MKKISLLCLILSLYKFGYTQTCQNCGVNQSNPQASLHVKGCGSTNSTFGFKVSNSLNKTALFIHDDLKVGIGAASNLYQLEVSDTNSVSGVQSIMRIANRYVATANNGSQILFGANRTTLGMTTVAGVSGLITDISSGAYKGALAFSTANNGAPMERMRINYLGNIGIGTSLPLNPLHVETNVYEWPVLLKSTNSGHIAYRNQLLIQRSLGGGAVTTGTNLGGLAISGSDGANYYSGWNGGVEISAFATQTWTSSARGTSLSFYTTANGTTGTAERIKIENNGNIGIGTAAPENLVHVFGNTDWNILMRSSSNTAGRNNVLIQRSLGAGAVTAGTALGGVSISGYDGSTYAAGWNGGAEIVALTTENWTSTARGTALIFTTSGNGTTSAPERVRINSNGNLGVGTTTPGYRIEAVGDIYANTGALMTSRNSAEGGSVQVYNHSKTGREIISYVTYNMTDLLIYGNKYSIWGYPASGGFGKERFSIWDKGDFTFHDSSSVERVRFNANGNVGIGTSSSVTNAKLSLKDGHMQIQQTTAPTVSIDGTAASATLSNATDIAGKISLTTATNSTAATITFNKSYVTAPVVVLTPTNAAAATELVSAKVYTTSTTTTFVINFGATPTTSVKTFNYVVVETQ